MWELFDQAKHGRGALGIIASLYDQLKEVDESIRQKENVRAAILEAINAEKETFNGTRNRLAVLPSHIQNKAKRRAV